MSATPPIGTPEHPLARLTRRELAKLYGVTVRSLERAAFIVRYGIPELGCMIERGELGLGPAEQLSRESHGLQSAICGGGAANVKRWAADWRRTTEAKSSGCCPQCGRSLESPDSRQKQGTDTHSRTPGERSYA